MSFSNFIIVGDFALPLPLVGRGRGGGNHGSVTRDAFERTMFHPVDRSFPPPPAPPHEGEGRRKFCSLIEMQ
jgi:hypothetical protein